MKKLVMITVALCALSSFALDIPISINEPAGIERKQQPATGGIPFLPGTVKDLATLAVVDSAGNPVPAQFSKLTTCDDGSIHWALLDLLADVPANGRTAYRIVSGQPAAPEKSLAIEENDNLVTIDTGVVKFTVDKKSFSLFRNVTVGGKPIVERSTATATLLEYKIVELDKRNTIHRVKEGGATWNKESGAPTRVCWEYKGPLRATLRVDGDFQGEGQALAYTARITAWAGSGSVRVEFSVRNSIPARGEDAVIKRNALELKLATSLSSQGSGLDWAAGGDGSIGLLVQDRHSAGLYRGPGTYLRGEFGCGWSTGWKGLYRQSVNGKSAMVEIISEYPPAKKSKKGALGFGPDGFFVLADRAHKDSAIWFDFYTGTRDAAANETRARAFRSKLMIFAPGKWYSETEALAMGHFGTLEDEIATYRKWGWKGADDAKKHPKMKHQPFAFVPKEYCHDVSEDDCAEGYLLQFLRTGERGFWDWAEAWAGYYRGQAIYRRDWGPTWGTSNAPPKMAFINEEGKTGRGNKVRAPKPDERPVRTIGVSWYGPHIYDWADSRMHGCHHYGRGIFEYYLMTGNTDALEAGLDLAKEMSPAYMKGKPGGSFSFGRKFGRTFLTVISAWKATRDPHWKSVADHYAALILKGKNWAPELNSFRQSLGIKNSYFARAWTKGHFDDTKPKGWKLRDIPKRLDEYLTKNNVKAHYDRGGVYAIKNGEKWQVTYLTQVFELSACHLAMERYARLFHSKEMVQRLIDVTDGVNRHYWSEKCHFMIGSPWFSWPDKDKTLDPAVWSPSHDKCPANGGGTHSGYATRYTADMFARVYSFTQDPKWMALARRSWSRGSKRLYQRNEQCAADDEVGPFAYIRGAHNNTMTECSVRLFYEAPRAK